MEVFVGNPPPGLDEAELEELIADALLKSQSRLLFWKRVNDPDVVVSHYEKVVGKSIRRYFVVQIEPNSLAPLAIHRLNGENLHGHKLIVREFHSRGYMQERRALNWRDKPWHKKERRISERRVVIVKDVEPEPSESAATEEASTSEAPNTEEK